MLRRTIVVGAALLLCASGVSGQGRTEQNWKANGTQPGASTLTIGSRAPELTIDKWIKGDGITGFEKGKVYVVEFWASWCAPCVAGMPHLTDIQNEYKTKGVTVIGVTSEDPENTLSAVENLVEDKSDTIGYAIAWDEGRATNKAWMLAATQRALPTAFVVNQDGVVAWIGHPMKIDEPLRQIVDRKYNLKTAAEKFNQAMKKQEQSAFARQQVDQFMNLLRNGQVGEAYALGDQLVRGAAKDDAEALNAIAWSLVDPAANIPNPDLGLALKASERADDLTGGKDPFVLDTVARVWFLKGNYSKAAKIQQKAVDNAGSRPELKRELQQRLSEYKAKK